MVPVLVVLMAGVILLLLPVQTSMILIKRLGNRHRSKKFWRPQVLRKIRRTIHLRQERHREKEIRSWSRYRQHTRRQYGAFVASFCHAEVHRKMTRVLSVVVSCYVVARWLCAAMVLITLMRVAVSLVIYSVVVIVRAMLLWAVLAVTSAAIGYIAPTPRTLRWMSEIIVRLTHCVIFCGLLHTVRGLAPASAAVLMSYGVVRVLAHLSTECHVPSCRKWMLCAIPVATTVQLDFMWGLL